MTVRWILTDTQTSASWTMPINPNQMSSPFPPAQRQSMPEMPGGNLVSLQAPKVPHEWTFGGVIRTQAHYEALLAWTAKNYPIDVTDHYGRTFRVLFLEFRPEDRRPTFHTPWRLRYQMRTLLLEEVS